MASSSVSQKPLTTGLPHLDRALEPEAATIRTT